MTGILVRSCHILQLSWVDETIVTSRTAAAQLDEVVLLEFFDWCCRFRFYYCRKLEERRCRSFYGARCDYWSQLQSRLPLIITLVWLLSVHFINGGCEKPTSRLTSRLTGSAFKIGFWSRLAGSVLTNWVLKSTWKRAIFGLGVDRLVLWGILEDGSGSFQGFFSGDPAGFFSERKPTKRTEVTVEIFKLPRHPADVPN